jgi:hypothetical protein
MKQEIETRKIADLSIEKEYASVSKDKPGLGICLTLTRLFQSY